MFGCGTCSPAVDMRTVNESCVSACECDVKAVMSDAV